MSVLWPVTVDSAPKSELAVSEYLMSILSVHVILASAVLRFPESDGCEFHLTAVSSGKVVSLNSVVPELVA